jgi:threonine/homoserine/homoserine lactone efflux protein
MTVYLLQGLTFGLSAGATPGPLHAYLMSQTLKSGVRRTIPAAFAPLLSDGPIITLVLLVLTQLPDGVVRGLHIVGGGFLIFLAWGAYRAFRRLDDAAALDPGSGQQSLRDATLVNLLNPNPYIFWGVVGGPILLDGWAETAGHGIAFLGAFYVALIGTIVAFIVIFGSARQLGPQVSRVLSGISAVALFVFGVYQIALGIR